ncbi:hypothetical protein C8R44DRAFT_746960 [Mycena epipterygia]|nr:hypothetical protein C8R44DRAFT_746960 [Mycena epipterygia]
MLPAEITHGYARMYPSTCEVATLASKSETLPLALGKLGPQYVRVRAYGSFNLRLSLPSLRHFRWHWENSGRSTIPVPPLSTAVMVMNKFSEASVERYKRSEMGHHVEASFDRRLAAVLQSVTDSSIQFILSALALRFARYWPTEEKRGIAPPSEERVARLLRGSDV